MEPKNIELVVDIVKCPYCEDSITSEECVCKNCMPLANIDIAIQSILEAVTVLKQNETKINKSRQETLNNAIYDLNNI